MPLFFLKRAPQTAWFATRLVDFFGRCLLCDHGAFPGIVRPSLPPSSASPYYWASSLQDNKRIAKPIRCRTLRSRIAPNQRASLLAGLSFIARTGGERRHPRQPHCGGAFRRRSIRPLPQFRLVVWCFAGDRGAGHQQLSIDDGDQPGQEPHEVVRMVRARDFSTFGAPQ